MRENLTDIQEFLTNTPVKTVNAFFYYMK